MTYWYTRQKYISQPLLLLQSVPCHHIVSEMYYQPSPSTDARQQRFQREFMPLATGASQSPNKIKYFFFLFPTITESSKPVTNEIWPR